MPPLRLACAEDAPVLVRLLDYASDGLAPYIWTQMAAPGEEWRQVGVRLRAERTATGEIIVVDEGAGPVAELTGYPITKAKSLDDLLPVLRPIKDLENRANPSWYVNVLSALPEARGRGLGTRLLGVAEEIARDLGLNRLSLIVADNNKCARRLYERQGFVEAERRAMVKNGWQSEGSEWVLMINAI